MVAVMVVAMAADEVVAVVAVGEVVGAAAVDTDMETIGPPTGTISTIRVRSSTLPHPRPSIRALPDTT